MLRRFVVLVCRGINPSAGTRRRTPFESHEIQHRRQTGCQAERFGARASMPDQCPSGATQNARIVVRDSGSKLVNSFSISYARRAGRFASTTAKTGVETIDHVSIEAHRAVEHGVHEVEASSWGLRL